MYIYVYMFVYTGIKYSMLWYVIETYMKRYSDIYTVLLDVGKSHI